MGNSLEIRSPVVVWRDNNNHNHVATTAGGRKISIFHHCGMDAGGRVMVNVLIIYT